MNYINLYFSKRTFTIDLQYKYIYKMYYLISNVIIKLIMFYLVVNRDANIYK